MNEDVLGLVLDLINTGSDYKSCLFTCKLWYKLIYNHEKELKFMNQLWTLVKLYPDAAWDWDRLSENPNITFDIMINNPTINDPNNSTDTNGRLIPCHWNASVNPNTTIDIVLNLIF